jgi:hypothetical protein
MLSCPLRLGRGWRDCHIRTARSLMLKPYKRVLIELKIRQPCAKAHALLDNVGLGRLVILNDARQIAAEARQRRHAVEDTGCTGCHDITAQTHAKSPP